MTQVTAEMRHQHIANIAAAAGLYAEGKVSLIEAAQIEAEEVHRFQKLVREGEAAIPRDILTAAQAFEQAIEKRKQEATPDE